mmetsp:Transcript_34230/g.67397  ORF Transcript_34230/g.67397 Transcript_34230/m.67397 type:complete len:107 (+) Transcript_34230:1021-1341(+)
MPSKPAGKTSCTKLSMLFHGVQSLTPLRVAIQAAPPCVATPPAAATAAAAPADSQPPLPPDLELCKLPVKELRRLLAERGANVAACFEKADLLEQAKLLRAAAPSA